MLAGAKPKKCGAMRAPDRYLDSKTGGPSPYSLAADLIPERGAKNLQSDKAGELARKAIAEHLSYLEWKEQSIVQ